MKSRVAGLQCIIIVVSVLISIGAVSANPPEGKGQKKHQSVENTSYAEPHNGAEILVTAGISISGARQIAINAGVNLGQYQSLPPGIRKNLARGKPLPPGIAKKVAPPGMINQLPVHPGYEWQVAGTDLLLVQIGTAIIADILSDVFR